MSDCKKCRARMLEALYGELGPADRDRFERHRRACPACAAEHAALAETLGLMDQRRRPDPGQEFWDGYWDRLSRRMVWEATAEGRRSAPARRALGRLFAGLPRWSYQVAGAAALLLVGILIGSRLVGPRNPAPMTSAAASGPSAAVVQAGNFIERSQVLLLGLVNHDPAKEDAYGFDLAGKKAVSRDLAAAAPALRESLNRPGERRLRDLVAELEVILMQIANLEAGHDLEGVELVKQGVDSRGLILKIDLARMSRDAAARGPVKKSQA